MIQLDLHKIRIKWKPRNLIGIFSFVQILCNQVDITAPYTGSVVFIPAILSQIKHNIYSYVCTSVDK